MSTSYAALDADVFLPDDLRAALHRRMRELGGLVLIALSASPRRALATWSVQGPELSHATSAPVRNLLGVPAPSPPI